MTVFALLYCLSLSFCVKPSYLCVDLIHESFSHPQSPSYSFGIHNSTASISRSSVYHLYSYAYYYFSSTSITMVIKRTPIPFHSCAFCCKSYLTMSQCASCQSIVYCSRECQRLDWSFHKIFCKASRSLGPRPSEGYSLALYFPVDLDPSLEWVRRPDCLLSKTNDKGFDIRSLGSTKTKVRYLRAVIDLIFC